MPSGDRLPVSSSKVRRHGYLLVSNGPSDSLWPALSIKPLHCPWLRTTRVASFLQVNVRKGPRAPGVNNTKWLYSMFSFEWGKQEKISVPFLWMKKLRFTHHTHMCVHMHILVRIKNILWCKLTHLFHCFIAMSPKSLAPSRNHDGGALCRGPKLEIRQQKKLRGKGRTMAFEQELPLSVANIMAECDQGSDVALCA